MMQLKINQKVFYKLRYVKAPIVIAEKSPAKIDLINVLFPFYDFKAFVTVLKGNRIHSFLEIFFLSKSFSKGFHSLENFKLVFLKKLFTKSLSSLIFSKIYLLII